MHKNAVIDIETWISKNTEKPPRIFREAVHTILFAITCSDYLMKTMIIKGGILLALRYQSTRFTQDIDFSTREKNVESQRQQLEKELEPSLAIAVESLDYGLDCRLQSCRVQPSNQPNPAFPSLKIIIGYAYKGSKEHKRLLRKEASSVIEMDFNYNESFQRVETIIFSGTRTLLAYSLIDLIAEKYRAILQQEVRNRARRQDVYDLFFLFQSVPKFSQRDKKIILETLIIMAESRNLTISQESLSDSKIRVRSKRNYHAIADEIEGELVDFDTAYAMVQQFYESLPW